MVREQAASNNLSSSWDGMLSLPVSKFTSMNLNGRIPILAISLEVYRKDTKKRCPMVILILIHGLNNGSEPRDPTRSPSITLKKEVLSKASTSSKDSVNLEMKYSDSNQ